MADKATIITSDLEVIEFDLVTSEESDLNIEVTKYPVESGQVFADHARVKQRELSLNIVVTDRPLTDIYNRDFGERGTDRSGNAYSKLKEIAIAKEPVTIITKRETLDNMMLTSLPRKDSIDTYKTLIITIGFTEIIVGNTKSVKYTKRYSSPKTKAKATPKQKIGTQPVVEPKVVSTDVMYSNQNNYSGDIMAKIVGYRKETQSSIYGTPQ